jgi:MGT family glycosyltransferase
MSVGRSTPIESLGHIPENFIVRNFVPQLEVLSRAALFITHAGMNSVHEGLFYNVPLILTPQQMEQRLVATRIEDLGAGVRLTSTTPSATEIAALVQRVMSEPIYRGRASIIGESLRAAGGSPRAVDEIEQMLTHRRMPG